MELPGHDGSGRRWRQARCRGGSPGANTPLATVEELRQSRLVPGLLRLGERLPALAWGMARGGKEGYGKGREVTEVGAGSGGAIWG